MNQVIYKEMPKRIRYILDKFFSGIEKVYLSIDPIQPEVRYYPYENDYSDGVFVVEYYVNRIRFLVYFDDKEIHFYARGAFMGGFEANTSMITLKPKAFSGYFPFLSKKINDLYKNNYNYVTLVKDVFDHMEAMEKRKLGNFDYMHSMEIMQEWRDRLPNLFAQAFIAGERLFGKITSVIGGGNPFSLKENDGAWIVVTFGERTSLLFGRKKSKLREPIGEKTVVTKIYVMVDSSAIGGNVFNPRLGEPISPMNFVPDEGKTDPTPYLYKWMRIYVEELDSPVQSDATAYANAALVIMQFAAEQNYHAIENNLPSLLIVPQEV